MHSAMQTGRIDVKGQFTARIDPKVLADLFDMDQPPPLWRRLVRRAYTRLLLAAHGDEVRDRLLNDPSLFNARHIRDFSVMAIHYNTMVDRRAALTAAQVFALLEDSL